MIDRELMQQALHTLEGWANVDDWVWPETVKEQAKRNTVDAITALRQAIEQAEQIKPVAWDASAPLVIHPHPAFQNTAPPQRQPLTDEECLDLFSETDWRFETNILKFARAIEAAHGIKGEE